MPWQNTPENRNRSDRTYNAEYRRNREAARRRAAGRCEGCGHKHDRLQCDHKRNVAAAGQPDNSLGNLQMLCYGPRTCQCHERKTAQEGGGFRRPPQARDPKPNPRTNWTTW